MAMVNRSEVPSIPERISVKTSVSNPRDRKRRSLPVGPPKESRRRSSNQVTVKPASTEVISSLIETLSAISTPAENHFDSFPDINASQSLPASPPTWRTSTSSANGAVNGHRNSHLHPDHASIRGSTRIAPSSNGSLRRASIGRSVTGSDDAHSIGQVSVEPQPWQSSTSLASGASEKGRSVRSTRSFKNLRLRSSKDSLQLVSRADRQKKEMTHKKDRLYLSDSRSPSPFPEGIHVRKRGVTENGPESAPVQKQDVAMQTEDTLKSPKRIFLNTDEASSDHSRSKRSSHALSSPENIPKRNSSIRHSRALSSSDRKRLSKSYKSEVEPVDPEKGDISVPSDISLRTAEEDTSDLEETEVTRRIRQLKEQKEQRDRTPMEDGPSSISPPRTPTRSPSPPHLAETHGKDVVQDNVADGTNHHTDLDNDTVVTQEDEAMIQEEPSAPPPTVRTAPLRPEREISMRSASLGSQRVFARHSPATSQDETRSASLSIPQRRNSSLLKRLSQPGSPLSGEKQKRRLSNPVPAIRTTSNLATSFDPVENAVQEYIAAPRLSQRTINPQTGRVVSFSEVGDPNGSVVFCCVGMGLTRYITAFYDELAATLKLRLITPDRPGVGDSELHEDGLDTPLGWPDDVRCICEHLGISKFSLLAHSAGAIYALATALRMPQHIRCRVHLLAPWIPPSQLSAIGTQQEPLPASALPYSQRVLRSLPTPFLKAANSSFFSITSITTSLPRSPKRSKRSKSKSRGNTPTPASPAVTSSNGKGTTETSSNEKENRPPMLRRGTSALEDIANDSRTDLKSPLSIKTSNNKHNKSNIRECDLKEKDTDKSNTATISSSSSPTTDPAPQTTPNYTHRLTTAIWDAATTNANSAIDLIVCLERRQPIGFRYVDITRAVVIHHGSKDTRVPVENVKWMGAAMRRCEVRVLESEGHGLMASAGVMGGVLMEMSREWEDWMRVVKGKRGAAGAGGGITTGGRVS